MNTTFQDIIDPIYTQAFTAGPNTDCAPVLEKALAAGFTSVNGQETKDKATFIKQFEFLRKLIPDLKFVIQEKIVAGNRVVVRSVATGSPKGAFMGLELDGGKTFKIDTIDIHTIENGQVATVYHLEDWATAMRQLRS